MATEQEKVVSMLAMQELDWWN